MNEKDNECHCEYCRQLEQKQKENPNVEYGMQYARWKLQENCYLLVSAEEIEYLNKEIEDDKPILFQPTKGTNIILAYGIFTSQTNWYEDFYDLELTQNSRYFYLDSNKNRVVETKIIDYKLYGKKNNEAKVAVLLESNELPGFPRDTTELAITLSKFMPELGDRLRDWIFSRVQYGLFRLDKGKVIPKKSISTWKENIDEQELFTIDYRRLLLIEEESK